MADKRQATQQINQAQSDDYQALVKKIADKVWKLWKQDLRYGRDRQGVANRKA